MQLRCQSHVRWRAATSAPHAIVAASRGSRGVCQARFGRPRTASNERVQRLESQRGGLRGGFILRLRKEVEMTVWSQVSSRRGRMSEAKKRAAAYSGTRRRCALTSRAHLASC